jgi:hypothetical protein
MGRLWLMPIIICYLAGTLYQLSLPGLHYDEAFEVVPTVQLLADQPTTPFRESAITLFGKKFPLTTQDYIGALNTYAALPFLAIGGINVISLRTYSILVGLLTLFLAHGFTADLSGRHTAGLAAAALLAVNPTFLFWSRQGIFVTAITAAIGLGAAWSWLRWWRRKAYRFALLGAFLFGLGLYAKLLFVWLIVALLGAFILRYPKLIIHPIQNWPRFDLSGKQIFGLILAGVGGCWPWILYNMQTGGTFKSLSDNAYISYYNVDNTDLLTNLWTRLGQVITLLNSGHLWYLGNIYVNNTMAVIFALALILSLWLAIKNKTATVLIPFIIISLVVGQSIVTISALWITHFALIMVWPAIALAVSGRELARFLSGQRWAKVALGLTFTVLIITEAKTSLNYHQALTLSGGLSTHSDAIYDLATWLDQRADRPVIAMDWGLAAPVTFLTAGKIQAVEVFGYGWATGDHFAEIVTPYLAPEAATFLWRAPDEIIFDRSPNFKALYHPLGLEETILEAFYERSGRPILGATQLVPIGTAENKPADP